MFHRVVQLLEVNNPWRRDRSVIDQCAWTILHRAISRLSPDIVSEFRSNWLFEVRLKHHEFSFFDRISPNFLTQIDGRLIEHLLKFLFFLNVNVVFCDDIRSNFFRRKRQCQWIAIRIQTKWNKRFCWRNFSDTSSNAWTRTRMSSCIEHRSSHWKFPNQFV